MILSFELMAFIHVGEWSNGYLYLRRKLNWDIIDYTKFTLTAGITGMIAQYTAIPLLSEKLKLRDSTIILIDFGGCFIQMIVLALATSTWMVYLSSFIACLESCSYTIIRCMISKAVEPDEVGKILSFVGAFQAFIPIISSPVFGTIYRTTLETLPQTYLIVIACLWFINFCINVYIDRAQCRIKKDTAIEFCDLKKKEGGKVEKGGASKVDTNANATKQYRPPIQQHEAAKFYNAFFGYGHTADTGISESPR